MSRNALLLFAAFLWSLGATLHAHDGETSLAALYLAISALVLVLASSTRKV